MATLTVTNTFVDATPAEAAEVNENFDDVVDFVNTQVIHRDASIAFTSTPSGPAADATTSNQFVRKAMLDAEAASRAAADTTLTTDTGRRGVRLFTAASHGISSDVVNPLFWSTEVGDSDFWSSGTDVVIPVGAGGIYALTVKATYVSGGNPQFKFRVRHTNDSEIWNLPGTLAINDGDMTQGFVATLAAGSTIRVDCMNGLLNSGIAIRGSLELWRISL